MRTTLKRGMGRGAAVNGNGRAVLPPAVSFRGAQVNVYRQPVVERGFLYYFTKTLLLLLVLVVTGAVGLAGGAYLYFHQTVRDVVARTPEVRLAQERLEIPPPGEAAISLVIGYDQRAGVDGDAGARSDTIMLVRADPHLKAVSMLSFPRDLWVEVHCPGQVFSGKINEAFSQCGPQGTVETVKHLTGLPINYLITVNFRGFTQVVAKLGGVWMDVDRRYFNPPGTGYAAIDLQPGYQKLGGQQALDFVRYRHFDSDFYRLARQQMFVQAFKQAVTTSFSPFDVPKITGVMRENLEIGAGGGEIDGRTVLSWGLFSFQLPSGRFFQTKIDSGCYADGTNFSILVAKECVDRAVQAFTTPDVGAAEKATAVAVGRKPKQTAPPPAKTTVVVLNGNGVPGAAADTSYQLSQHGYQTLEPANGEDANAPTQNYERTQIYYDATLAPAEQAAARLAGLFGGEESVDVTPVPAEIDPYAGQAMLSVVLGQNYSGSVAPAPVDQTPERKPPDTVVNPDATIQAVREAQRQARFPLLVPRVLEKSSRLDHEAPVRVYDLAGRRAVRLTFITGRGEYWGIQMVRWGDAPAIRGPSESVTLGGRDYELHYTGSKLHMVVLRHAGATYWVVNTLLDSLSNETMLAIAKGLRPLDAG